MKYAIVGAVPLSAFALSACTNESSVAAANESKVYRSNDHPASFRYTSNWTKVAHQSRSTLVLLYEQSGTGATANLSVVRADKSNVKEYDEAYFHDVFGDIPGFNLRSLKYVDTLSGANAVAEYDFIMNVQGQQLAMTSLTAFRLNRGLRYTFVVNARRERMSRVKHDAEIMFSTLLFER